MGDISMESLGAIFGHLSEAVVLLDSNGRILAANGRADEAFGWPADRFLGRTLGEAQAEGFFVPPALRRSVEERRRQSLVQEVKGRRLAMVASPVGDMYLLVARDITELDRLQHQLERLEQERERFRSEVAGLRASYARRDEIIGTSKAMQKVMELANRVAAVDSTILVLGESGVGKGLVAKAIHQMSRRTSGPFVKVDCGALPETLLESELFGYTGGAFTGARREGKVGLIEQARSGTLFLDEMAELTPALQVKLLQVIQERTFTRVGGVTLIRVDVRIIAATHRNLEQLVAARLFREDLFYRLNVVPITIPPLRERREDIPVLVRSFLDQFRTRYRVEKSFSPEVMQRLVEYHWPGNVRELENMVERLVVTTEGEEVGGEDLPPPLQGSGGPVAVRRIAPLAEALAALETEMIATAYRQLGSSVKVGKALGIHQTTAARKIRERQLRRPSTDPHPEE